METKLLGSIQKHQKEFKSYYVVWKLSAEEKMKLLSEGLNRTMQYGNATTHQAQGYLICLFKSYYVVWKHDDIKKDFAPGDIV